MPRYTIRIELHDADWQEYVDMAKDLARKGITDLITDSNGTTYKMSPAEYNYEGTGDIGTVFQAARDSANQTGRSNAVFVTEASQRKWAGLPVAQARRSA